MKRSDFLKSLGVLAGMSFMPEAKPEKLTLPTQTSDVDHRLAFDTGNVERMRIYSAGYIGLGTINPDHKLEIYEGKGKLYGK